MTLTNAIIACILLSISYGPLGTMLVIRRMSMMGDALSHAILPGVVIAFSITGFSVMSMSIGGVIAGITIVLLTTLTTRLTHVKEDANFTALFLIALALGTFIALAKGTDDEILHLLFGNMEGIGTESVIMIAIVSVVTVIGLLFIYKPLILDSFDPVFFKLVNGGGFVYHFLFLTFVVFNLVAGFQNLGTLMTLGLMMLPAISARFWAQKLWKLVVLSSILAIFSSLAGLFLADLMATPPGPSIVLVSGAIYIISVLFGTVGGIITPRLYHSHLRG